MLEENLVRIAFSLRVAVIEKIDIYIYPDLGTFHKAIDRPNSEDWLVGNCENGVIRVVSPENPGPQHSYESIRKVIIHELIHLVTDVINTNVPEYLAEGVACYMAGQDDGVDETIIELLQADNFPAVIILSEIDEVYQIGYAFVEYVVSEYGYSGLRSYYAKPSINDIFNLSDNSFYADWTRFLKVKHSISEH